MESADGRKIARRVKNHFLNKYTNLTAWAREKGFNTNHTFVYLTRWSGRDGRPEAGTNTSVVIKTLELETGIKICGFGELRKEAAE